MRRAIVPTGDGARLGDPDLGAALLEAVPSAVVACDADGHVTRCNRAARELLGGHPEVLQRDGWTSRYGLFEADGRTPLTPDRAPLARVLAGEDVQDVQVVLRADGRRTRALSVTGQALRDAAGDIAGAIVSMHDVTEREVAHRRAKRHAEDLQALAAITRQLAASGDVASTATTLVRAAQERTGASSAHLWQRSEYGDAIEVTYAVGIPAGTLRSALDDPLCGAARAWRTSAPVRSFAARHDGRLDAALVAEHDLEAAWYHPVVGADGTEAVLSVWWRQAPGEHPDHFAPLMQVLADHAGAALVRAHLLADLEALATTDELTGLPNRRAWQLALGRTHATARRHGTPFAVAMLDLDRFKAFNDTHGHIEGDRLLREAAHAWRRELRPNDVLARYGGEEFILLLPHTDVAGARDVVERLRSVTPGGQTCSAGIVAGDAAGDPKALVQHADEALYAAKAAGRDRAVTWGAEDDAPAPVVPVRTADRALRAFETLGAGSSPEVVVAAVRELLAMEVAYVTRHSPEEQLVVAVAGDAAPFGLRPGSRFPLEATLCQAVLDGRVPSVVPDVAAVEAAQAVPVARAVGLRAFVSVPVRLADGRVHGTLCGASREPRPGLGAEELRYLRVFARMLAGMVEQREEAWQESGIQALAAAVEARDAYTGEHSQAVVGLVQAVGAQLGLDERAIAEAGQVALLHDLGKLRVPDAILHKPGPLDEAEWEAMREHPAIGSEIVSTVPGLEHLAPAILAEHERWDGGGYPRGLRGEEIPVASRIAFVCDAFHAMTSDRPYRRAMPVGDALAEIEREAGGQFCPRAAAALLAVAA